MQTHVPVYLSYMWDFCEGDYNFYLCIKNVQRIIFSEGTKNSFEAKDPFQTEYGNENGMSTIKYVIKIFCNQCISLSCIAVISAVLIGIVLGIVLGALLLLIVHCFRRFVREHIVSIKKQIHVQCTRFVRIFRSNASVIQR